MPGGAFNYIVKGKMIGGFVLIAYPAEYGNSAVMTFMVNHAGAVHQKDIGTRAESIAKRIHLFDPDQTWKKVMWRPLKRRKAETMSFAIQIATVALFAVVCSATSSLAQAPGYVRVKIVKAALMVGAGGGSGVLTYRGRDYPFRVSGLSLGVTAGASVSRLEGWASHIRQVSDFAGTYSAVGLGGALVGGVGGVQLRNEKGVSIDLKGPKAGMEFAANLSGIEISLK